MKLADVDLHKPFALMRYANQHRYAVDEWGIAVAAHGADIATCRELVLQKLKQENYKEYVIGNIREDFHPQHGKLIRVSIYGFRK